jgi:hypothetical protein
LPDTSDEAVIARAQALLAWTETVELLAWWRIVRHPAETYGEFARRAARELRVPLGFDRDATAGLGLLAEAATKADYSRGLSAAEAHAAARAAASVERALRGSATTWQRWRLAVDPRLMVASGRPGHRDGELEPAAPEGISPRA